jgi:4-hydroxy-3-methylbut-2-en-1-yl diphosphate reductase
MRIVTATAAGMCFGVRDALNVLAGIEQPRSVAIYGELVHNDVVLYQLKTRGFRQVDESNRNRLPAEPRIVITAHGISQRRRQELLDSGKTLIDTTCPLVTRVHQAARDLAQSGALVVVIGRPDHVEVQGITGDLDSFVVVPSVAAVATYSSTNIGIVCQTTFPSAEAAAIRRQIADLNPTAGIHWVDTICQPTKDRQHALAELMEQVQAVVVVGGLHSNNTLHLVAACQHRGLPTYHVQNPGQLDPAWFTNIDIVGLTAGTSTLPETLQQVQSRLLEIARAVNESASPLLRE